MDVSTIIAAVLSAIGGGGIGSIVTKYLVERQKQADAQCLLEDAQTMKTYEIIVTRLEARIVKLEGDHQKCMDAHLDEARALGELRGRFAEQSAALLKLQTDVKDNTKAIQEQAKAA